MPAWKSSSLVLRKQSRAIAFARRFLTTSLFFISSSDLVFMVYLSAVRKRDVGRKKHDADSVDKSQGSVSAGMVLAFAAIFKSRTHLLAIVSAAAAGGRRRAAISRMTVPQRRPWWR